MQFHPNISEWPGSNKWNNVPFTNASNDVDPLGGLTVAPGKGSHSYSPAGNGQVKLRSGAGVRNSTIYSLMKFITPTNAAKGEFHFAFSKAYPDAPQYLRCFSANGGNVDVRRYWECMSKAIVRLLRKYPANIIPAEALKPCETKINADLFSNGQLKFCTACTDFHACQANKEIGETIKDRFFLNCFKN